MENNRTKQLLPLQTVIGAINLNIKGRMQTFNVLYSGAMLPWIDGKMLFVPEKRYNAMLRDFFLNEGKEYIIPSVTQIAQDRANVINAYTEGRLGDMYAKEEEKETQQVAEESSNEQEMQAQEEQKAEQSEELANSESKLNENKESYKESVEENNEVEKSGEESFEEIEEPEQVDNSNEYEESEPENEEAHECSTGQQEQEKENEVEEIDDDDLLNFSVNSQYESNDTEESRDSANEMQKYMVDDTPSRETRSARHAQRVAEYCFSDESLDDLKEIIRDQNKIMMHQNEIIMNLNDAVVKQQEAIDTFKGKINNANLFVKSNQKKNYIVMIICLLITIATVVGMQLYAPKMESAIQLDPNTDAEVHIVIHNDDGTDSFERIGTLTITDGKLTVGE